MILQKRLRLPGACAAMLLCVCARVEAQGFAARGGLNVNPDQVYVGGQYEVGPIADRVWLQPNADAGRGDGATLLAVNFDLAYRRPLQRRGIWTGYVGGGPAINHYRVDTYQVTEMGLGLLAGLMHANGLFTDFRVGFFDSPRFRVGIGYAFRPTTRAPRRP